MPRLTRRAVRASTVLTAVAVAYASGVATGVVGSGQPPAGGRRALVIDEAADHIARDASRPVSRGELERAAVGGMLESLQDPWSRYYTPTEYQGFRSWLDGQYSGVGLWLGAKRGERVEVTSVQPGSPADRAGVHAGDAIVEVDGRHLSRAGASQVASALRGRSDTTVSLLIDRGTERRRLTLVRAELPVRAVAVRQAGEHVMVIKVSEFTRGTGGRVRDAMTRRPARHAGGVVLDLRGNPGGLVDEAVETASAFLAGGPVVSYVRRGHPADRLAAAGGGDPVTPLVVLVDGGTASAAEIVAGALRDRGRAVIVGSRTFGKSSVQEARRLPDGSALKLTVGRYVTPSGHDIDGVGIEPDVFVGPDDPRYTAERRGLDVLAGLMASLPSTAGRG